jgi:hypothetical protein
MLTLNTISITNTHHSVVRFAVISFGVAADGLIADGLTLVFGWNRTDLSWECHSLAFGSRLRGCAAPLIIQR